MGKKLGDRVADLRKGLEKCLIAPRYDDRFLLTIPPALLCPFCEGFGRMLAAPTRAGGRSPLNSLPQYVLLALSLVALMAECGKPRR